MMVFGGKSFFSTGENSRATNGNFVIYCTSPRVRRKRNRKDSLADPLAYAGGGTRSRRTDALFGRHAVWFSRNQPCGRRIVVVVTRDVHNCRSRDYVYKYTVGGHDHYATNGRVVVRYARRLVQLRFINLRRSSVFGATSGCSPGPTC